MGPNTQPERPPGVLGDAAPTMGNHVPQPSSHRQGVCICGRWLWSNWQEMRYEHAA